MNSPIESLLKSILLVPESHIILNTRVFPYPPDFLYRAWSDPDLLKIWWGPSGFRNTFHEFEFVEGGKWRFTMHGPDKGNYENEVEFLNLEAPHLIHWKRLSQPYFNILGTFEEEGKGHCRLNFRMIFRSAESCAKLRPHVVDKNEENFDRLGVLLQKMRS